MNWTLVITGPARKELRNLSAKDLERVRKALRDMECNPFGGDIVHLQMHPAAWRRRVGNYRIFFDVDPAQAAVVVTSIRRRTSTTYR